MKLLRNILVGIGAAALLVAVLGAAWVFYGGVEVAADREHSRPVAWLLETARQRAVERQAREVDLRLPELTREEEWFEAVVGYEDMCAVCHVPPGGSTSALARGLNPPAPDLAEVARQRSAEALFWVTKHGIRMSGMPAWGITHSDDELWTVVALVRAFPDLGGADYQRLLESARAAGMEHDHGETQEHEHSTDPGPDHEDEHEHEHDH